MKNKVLRFRNFPLRTELERNGPFMDEYRLTVAILQRRGFACEEYGKDYRLFSNTAAVAQSPRHANAIEVLENVDCHVSPNTSGIPKRPGVKHATFAS